jgi:Bacteriophage lambda head decoration protein D
MVAQFRTEGTLTRDNLVGGYNDLITRQITLISGQNLKRGTLLGKITASGKYTLSLSASADGSQTPSVILLEDTDASGGDKVTVGAFAGTFDENGVIFGTGHTAASTREALRDVGILLQSSIL